VIQDLRRIAINIPDANQWWSGNVKLNRNYCDRDKHWTARFLVFGSIPRIAAESFNR
jgi:hypothetical protein